MNSSHDSNETYEALQANNDSRTWSARIMRQYAADLTWSVVHTLATVKADRQIVSCYHLDAAYHCAGTQLPLELVFVQLSCRDDRICPPPADNPACSWRLARLHLRVARQRKRPWLPLAGSPAGQADAETVFPTQSMSANTAGPSAIIREAHHKPTDVRHEACK